MSGPRVTSGRDSVQKVGTPTAFLGAVERRFGPLTWDLAADESNHVTVGWYGAGAAWGDSLIAPWNELTGLLWLNPPYSNLAPWAKKCALSAIDGARIAFLVPASVGSNWFAEYVDDQALVLFLRPRLTFVGHTAPYPKDLILAVYGEKPGYECWKWNEEVNRGSERKAAEGIEGVPGGRTDRDRGTGKGGVPWYGEPGQHAGEFVGAQQPAEAPGSEDDSADREGFVRVDYDADRFEETDHTEEGEEFGAEDGQW